MSKIKLTIDLKDGDSIAKAVKMLQAINGTTVTVETTEETETEETVEEEPKKKAPRKPRQTRTPEPETETEEVEEETAEEEKPKKTEGDKSDIGITEVRALLAEKVGDHRDLIKNKLTELGASSVTTLEESKYKAFHDFLDYL